MKGLWETDTWTNTSYELSEESGDEVDDEEETNLSIQLVETHLLEMVDQQERAFSGKIVEFVNDSPVDAATDILPIHRLHAYPCADTHKKLPIPPTQWPQAPLMLRPTPGSNMKIRGIRYADSTEYQTFPGVCAGCILPVNNGQELPGKSLVVDFEAPLFVGTLLMRVAGAATVDLKESSSTSKQTSASYFDGKKRKFQVVIKGRFRQEGIPVSDCVTGQVFERAAGQLPARWIVHALVTLISRIAPQLEAELDGDRPRFLTPLVATAHTVLAKHHAITTIAPQHAHPTCIDCSTSDSEKLVNFSIYAGSATMEEEVEEPPSDDPLSVMPTVNAAFAAAGRDTSLAQRRAARKKFFNQVAAQKAAAPVFDTEKEYTFEFFQHLLLLTDPDDFKINVGTSRVQVGLARSLNGQPIKIMAARRQAEATTTSKIMDVLWSFDLWHQALYPYAKAALKI